jgi:hypothetical protein
MRPRFRSGRILPMKKFLVVARHGRPQQWSFHVAQDVAAFMWGKDLMDYDIFIRTDRLPVECTQMQKCLERMALDTYNDL